MYSRRRSDVSGFNYLGLEMIEARKCQAVLLFFGLIVCYSQRINLSVGIVAMTDNSENPHFPEVSWNTMQRSAILSAFFYGYLILQIPAGLAAGKFGPCLLLGGVSVVCGVLTLLVPFAAVHGNWMWVFAARVAQGLAQGCIYPCVYTHLSKWAVPDERNMMVSFVFGGTQVGTIVILMTGGLLVVSSAGWPSIFYSSGGLSIVWGLVFMVFGADSPAAHRSISDTEREFIESKLQHSYHNSKELKFPWCQVLSSVPLLALLLAHTSQNWAFWTLLTLTPSYMKGVLHFNIEQNGFLSSLPYLAMWLTSFIFGYLGDFLIQRKILSTAFSRKMWNSIAFYGGGVFLILLAYVSRSSGIAVTFLTVSVALNAGTYPGYLSNHMDLSPNFAGTLLGITNGIANITSILGPMISGILVPDLGNADQWKVVFLISAGVFILGNSIFILFGSTRVQPWNDIPEETHYVISEEDFNFSSPESLCTNAPLSTGSDVIEMNLKNQMKLAIASCD